MTRSRDLPPGLRRSPLLAAVLAARDQAGEPPPKKLDATISWVGNSFSGAAGKARSQSVLTLTGAPSSDVRLDVSPEELYYQAMIADRWRGTCSVDERLPYWAEGILACVHEQDRDAAARNGG